MAGIEVAREEAGGLAAQVLDASHPWLGGFDDFATRVRAAWDGDTAWIDDWDHRNPARGQCGSSSLVLQDECGARLVRGLVHDTGRSVRPVLHYWNLVHRRHVDLTWQQFSDWAFVIRWEPVDREQLLVTSWFTDRYETLRARVDGSGVAAALAG